ncbi:MAG: hypothetical protein NTY03_04205 [Candidatus Bathyarchaeota archaeon]|nr:hypothetical protein [Candidatus Bathyarchaeota archaeon]
MSEKVEVKVQLDAKVYQALEWYLKHTSYWVGNDHLEESLSGYIADIVKEWLEMEATNPQDALESIKDEMKILLQ